MGAFLASPLSNSSFVHQHNIWMNEVVAVKRSLAAAQANIGELNGRLASHNKEYFSLTSHTLNKYLSDAVGFGPAKKSQLVADIVAANNFSCSQPAKTAPPMVVGAKRLRED
jgi:hypothetical protein